MARDDTPRLSGRLTAMLYNERSSGFSGASFGAADDPYGLKLHTGEAVKLLVINCGSSSLKYNLFDTADETNNVRGQIERIGQPCLLHTQRRGQEQTQRELPAGSHREAFAAMVAGLDALIFTGGIGQGSAGMRGLACQTLGCLGVVIDEAKNHAACGQETVCDIACDGARVHVLVVPTDEERMIARETLRAIGSEYITGIVQLKKHISIPIEVSAHHVHLSAEHVEALFGPGHALTPEAPLSQPGQFACVEKVHLVGPKGRVERVRVLGPARKQSQVEISMTEQFRLGIQPPVRESGDLDNTPGVTLEGPAGSVALDKGVICAMRHIHMSDGDAAGFGLHDKHMVRVRVASDRELVFGDVLVRVSPNYRLAMHIDTDEANAAGIATGVTGRIEALQTRN